MNWVPRLGLRLATFFLLASFLVGQVAAEANTGDDPQAGFGVMIAMIAIVIALIIARHKRQKYV